MEKVSSTLGEQTNEMGRMAGSQMEQMGQTIQQGLSSRERRKAEEGGGGIGQLLGPAIELGASFLPGAGPMVGKVAGAAASRFL